MDNIAGPPVDGDNFFAREEDVKRIKEALRQHDLLLLGPRRIGKTSACRAVLAVVRKEAWHAVEINVASCTDERGFLEKLEAALHEAVKSLPGKMYGSLKTHFVALGTRIKSVKIMLPGETGSIGVDLGEGGGEDWSKAANDILKLIANLKHQWLVYIDELPIFLYTIIRNDKDNGVARVRRFLDWFRNDVRQLPCCNNVRWLISGSIGLDTLVQQHRMADTINSLPPDTLPPFKRPVAQEMLRTLAKAYAVTLADRHIDTFLDAIQWLQPYYIQVCFNKLRGLIAEEGAVELDALIDRAVQRMTEPGADNDFHHWETRLEWQLPADKARHAKRLLTCAAAKREGVRSEVLLSLLHESVPEMSDDEALDLFRGIRDILRRDGYWALEETPDGNYYRFLLEPLRRWWQQQFTV